MGKGTRPSKVKSSSYLYGTNPPNMGKVFQLVILQPLYSARRD